MRATLPAANGYVETRSYDRAGRLSEVAHARAGVPLAFFQYAYDPVGNPTSVTAAGSVTTYAYDLRDRLTSAACVGTGCLGEPLLQYGYDAVGNRLTESRAAGTTAYSYDAADQLSSSAGPGGTVTFGYDDSGEGN